MAGKEVFVESDKQDIYGRELGRSGYSHLIARAAARRSSDGNYAQVLAGMAWWYRYYARSSRRKIVDGMNPLKMKRRPGMGAVGW